MSEIDCTDRNCPGFGFGCKVGGPAVLGPMTYVGKLRVYFNRHGAAPRLWCVAPEAGGWEIAVHSVTITGPSAETVYRPKATADEDDGKPSAWIAVEGQLTVHLTGHASIGTP